VGQAPARPASEARPDGREPCSAARL